MNQPELKQKRFDWLKSQQTWHESQRQTKWHKQQARWYRRQKRGVFTLADIVGITIRKRRSELIAKICKDNALYRRMEEREGKDGK